MKNSPVKTIVAIGVGAALFFVLGRFVSIPSPVPNTNIATQYGLLAFMAVMFGPVAGALIGLIGHALIDFSYGWGIWWSWVIASGVFGLLVGLVSSRVKVAEGEFGKKDILVFNLAQIVAHVVAWIVVAPVLDILMYAEPANKAFLQGVVGGASNIVTTAIIGTLLNGIIIGNMGLATILGVISMVPSIFFAAFGAKFVGKHGSKKGIVFWSVVSMVISIVTFGFFLVIDPKQIAVMGSVPMILYVVLTLAQNGSNMCITTANTSFMADTIDYELDRSGRYIPAVVSGTYSLVDKLITSFSAVIATGAVALIGYTTTMPQPGDPCTSGVFWLTMSLRYGLPIFGWVVTLVAMKVCPLSKEEMVNVQKRIAEKKAAARHEFIEQELGAKVES